MKNSILLIVLLLCGCTAPPPGPVSTVSVSQTAPFTYPSVTITDSPQPAFTRLANTTHPDPSPTGSFLTKTPPKKPSPIPSPSPTPFPVDEPSLTFNVWTIVRRYPHYLAPVITRVAANTMASVKGRYGDEAWVLIDLGDGQTGWVRAPGLYNLVGNSSQVPQISLTIPPPATPTPICTPQHNTNQVQSVAMAQEVLVDYFRLLSEGQFAPAVQYFSGDIDFLKLWNMDIDPQDTAYLFWRACTWNHFKCLPVRRIAQSKAISPGVYEFVVEFSNKNGSLFSKPGNSTGPGTEGPRVSQWTYRVVLDCHGQYLVQVLPVYGG